MPVPDSPAAAPARIPRPAKIHFGMGFVGNNLMVIGLESLIFPVFSLYLGLPPALIGLALIAPRVWDGLVDLFIGRYSDNLRTRWGRRRPLIVAGAIAAGLAFALIWMVPASLAQNHAATTVWLIATLLLFWTAQAVFYVPLEALGMTLTPDYHERTVLMAYRSFFAKVGQLASAWCFWLVESGYFGTGQAGAVNVGWLWAGLIVITCAWPGILLRDPNPTTAPGPRIRLLPALQAILRRPVFLRLSGFLIFASGSMSISSGIHFYTNLHYVAGSDAAFAARLTGVGTSLNIISGVLALPLVSWVSGRVGKHRAAQLAVALTGIGSLLSWVLFTPRHPWLSLGVTPFIGMGIVAVYQLYFALLADAAEESALETGQAAEGLFSASTNCLAKLGQAAALATGGVLLGWIGIEGRDFKPNADQLHHLRLMRMALPALLAFAAVACLHRYPLTRDRLESLRAHATPVGAP